MAKSMGGTSFDSGRSITTDASGNVYTTGYFQNTVDFNPGSGVSNLVSNGSYDIFISKLDANGNFIWAKSMGGTSSDYGYSITTDASGNVYTTGSFAGTVDFDPGSGVSNLVSNGSSDIFIQKLDANGNFLWAKSMGGTSYDSGTSITTDASGNVYTTGTFTGIVDFDPSFSISNLNSSGGYTFIQKLDANGNFIWAEQVNNLASKSINIDANGNLYITATDYIFKFKDCANSSLYNHTACNSYTWIDGNTYTANNNTATHTLTNVNGCDSVITLNLSINNSITTGTDVQTACDTYTWIDGNTYTSNNNTATHTLTNSIGCDSVVTLSLSILNSTTGTDLQTACNTFTWIDGNTYTASNNTASHTLTNSVACDSVVYLDLSINYSNTGIDSHTACDSYSWIDGNTYYSSNNTATHLFTNSLGCDSVVTLNLTINNSTTSTDVQSACSSYTWIDGNTYTSNNNTATYILTNSLGCDSIITLDLTLNNNTHQIWHTQCGGAFTLNGQQFTSTGSYNQTFTNVAGCDSVLTLNLTINNNQFAVDYNASQQVYSAPPFYTTFTNITPNISNYDFTWNFGDGTTAQSNSTTVNHLYQFNGLYDVTLYAQDVQTNCIDSLLKFEYIYCTGGANDTTSINDYYSKNIKLYPNPTSKQITVEIKGYKGSIELELFSLSGKLLLTHKGPNLSLRELERGVYLVKVKLNEQYYKLFKVIKL